MMSSSEWDAEWKSTFCRQERHRSRNVRLASSSLLSPCTISQTILQSPKRVYTIRDRFTCQSEKVVYSIICLRCGCLYIGETGRRLRERITVHLRSVRNNSPGFPVAEHFNSAFHSLDDMMICGLKRCSGDNTRRKKQEMRLIFELGTLKLNGTNINFTFI